MNSLKKKLRVYLVDDEPLALKRLSRLLLETNRVEIIGRTTNPPEALKDISSLKLDAVFLDIQMPEMSGFEILAKLEKYPPVIFTTAFEQYALKAFEVYSVDYLLKPIEVERLEKTLHKLEMFVDNDSPGVNENVDELVKNFVSFFTSQNFRPLEKLASRIGGKILILDVTEITHFYSEDKLSFAQNIEGRQFPIDFSLNELEKNLNPHSFLRVHRNSIINLNKVSEIHGWFIGKVLVRLKDVKKTEIVVARDRVKILKIFFAK